MNSPLRRIIIATALVTLTPALSSACNWVRVEDNPSMIECRSNYKSFFTADSKVLSQLLLEATYYALGEAKKLSTENWAIRNTLTLKDSDQLFESRFQAEQILNSINAHIRQRAVLDTRSTLSDKTIPSAFLLGVTVPINADISKLPLGGPLAKVAPTPGGSLFLGWAMIPQKVQFVLDDSGTITAPKIMTEKAMSPTTEENKLNSILAPAPGNSVMNSLLGNIRMESRFVIIPSFDLKSGQQGKYKATTISPTLGLVFGRHLFRSHQLLNSGPTASVPGRYARVFKNTAMGKFLPNWLVTPIEKYVDTIKVGRSLSAQKPNQKAKTDKTQQFSNNTFVWLRFTNKKFTTKTKSTTKDIAEGKFRAGYFWMVSPTDDGENDFYANGIDFEGLNLFGSSFLETLSETLKSSEDNQTFGTLDYQIKEIERSLDNQSLDADTRKKVEQGLDVLKRRRDSADETTDDQAENL